jgi:hypothetical protein
MRCRSKNRYEPLANAAEEMRSAIAKVQSEITIKFFR